MKWYQFIGTTFSALAGKREVAMYADDDLQHWGRLGVRGALPEMGDDTLSPRERAGQVIEFCQASP